MKNIPLHIRSIHISGSKAYTEAYVLKTAAPMEKFNLIMAQIHHIAAEAQNNPNYLYLITCPEGMIASVDLNTVSATEQEYQAMCKAFNRITQQHPNLLLMPGTIVYPTANNKKIFNNPAPIFYQGSQYTYIQALSPEASRFCYQWQSYIEVSKKLVSNPNNQKLFYLNFQGEDFILAPLICVEHLANLHENISELYADNAIEVVLSYGTSTNIKQVHAPCFIHDEIADNRTQGIVKDESSIVKICSRKHYDIPYTSGNILKTRFFWSNVTLDADEYMIDKTITRTISPTHNLQ